ncbi:MAG: hypothetical protein FJ255_12795 [Phycisphaerae bacterium]|nr:hypothetical protein [Phycisphaerae bacterium]
MIRRRAFSMIEATMSIVLLSGVFLASAEVVRMVGLSRAIGEERARALAVGQDLLQEIAVLPLGTHPVAVALDNTPVSRAAFATVYEYSGLVDSPPRSRDGAALDGYSGWTRRITITTLNPETLARSLGPGTGVAQVLVEVSRGNRVASRMSIIRTSSWDAVRFDARAFQSALTFTNPPVSTPPELP